MAAPAASADATAWAAASPVATGRAGAESRVRSASGRVASSETTAARLTPGAPASTAYRPNGTPSAGTSSTSASSASATPVTVPVSLPWPGGSPACAAPSRTPVASPAPRAPGTDSGGMRANSTASAAVSRPSASPGSSSSSLPSSAAVATTG